MHLNWDNIYNWGLLVMSFTESPIPTNRCFLALFYSSLTCKLWILFRTFRDMRTWTVLKYYRIFGTILYRKINFNRQPVFSYFLLVNKLYNLNLFKLQNNVSDKSRSLSAIYIWGLLTLFVYGKFNSNY